MMSDLLENFELARDLLRREQWIEGFEKMEARLPFFSLSNSLAPPQMNESYLHNKTVLVTSEQGLGDQIQFSRFIIDLIDLGAIVTFKCDPSLHPLMQTLSPNLLLVSLADPNQFNHQAPLLSLPFLLQKNGQFWRKPYLHGQAIELPDSESSGFQNSLGLFWRCNPHHPTYKNRSIPLGEISKLKDLWPQFVCLQKDVDIGEKKVLSASLDIRWVDNLDHAAAFSDSTNLLGQLKGLITCDSSMAHLAGAMGVRTILVVPTPCDWRWGSEQKQSIWYPSVKIIRSKFDHVELDSRELKEWMA